MSTRVIEVVDFDPNWSYLFETEKALIQKLFKNEEEPVIHHVGSTSVPGLCAKPVIDILMEVQCLDDLDNKAHQFSALGYEVLGEYGLPGRRYLQKGGNQRSHHIHAWETGNSEIQRHLAFRDYLRASPAIAKEYAEIKKAAARNCENDVRKYAAHKNSFIKEIERMALEYHNS